MAGKGKQGFKESRGDTLGFLGNATPEQLLAIAAGTALRVSPQVAEFGNSAAPAYYQKTDDLRRLIVREFNRHADFRGLVIRTVLKMGVVGAKPAKPAETAAPKSAEGKKPKKGK